MIQTFYAPAKINLCLHVLGKRPDGYHELLMLMQRVSLFDEIELSLEEGEGVEVLCDGLILPEGEQNIAEKAARLLLEDSGVSRSVKIHIRKRIPSAAGLGGGSSDAATVLLGLCRLLGLNYERKRLMELGLRLGADVPFFLFEQTAWARGVGERLEAVEKMPHFHIVLVNPGVEVSTGLIFKNLGLTTPERPVNLPAFEATGENVLAGLHNDLETVTCAHFPIVGEVKAALASTGSLGTLMSGSGATVFALYNEPEAAEASRDRMRARGWWAEVVEPL